MFLPSAHPVKTEEPCSEADFDNSAAHVSTVVFENFIHVYNVFWSYSPLVLPELLDSPGHVLLKSFTGLTFAGQHQAAQVR